MRTLGVVVLAVCLASAESCATAQLKGPPAAVEVWRTGNESFTSQLGAAIERAIAKAPNFTRVTDQRPGNLVVLIPGSVKWTRSAERIRISYEVAFSGRLETRGEKELGSASGECWLDDLDSCTKTVMHGLADAAVKMRANRVP